jgi:small-conductance mechanosensitive channel
MMRKTRKTIGLHFLKPLFGLLLLAASAIPLLGIAQAAGETESTSAEVPQALQPAEFEALVSKMDSEQQEALASLLSLVGNSLGTDAPATAEELERERLLTQFKRWGTGFEQYLLTQARDLPLAISRVYQSAVSIFKGRGLGGSTRFLLLLLLVLAIGYAAERLFDRFLSGKRESIRSANTSGMLETFKVISLRALLECTDVLAFVVVSLIVTRFVFDDAIDRKIAGGLIVYVVLIFRLASAILKFILAPRRPDLRLVAADNWTAQYLFRNFAAITTLVGIGFYLQHLGALFELPGEDALRFWLSLFLLGWLVTATWRARKGLTSIIVGEDAELTPGLERMAAWWPAISIVVFIGQWLITRLILSTGYTGLSGGQGALIMLLIIMLPFLDTIVRGVASHLVPAMAGEGPIAEKAQEATRLSYIRIGRVVLVVVIFLLVVRLMGLSLMNLAQTGLGAQMASYLVGFFLILAVGYMSWEIAGVVINRKLAREMQAQGGGHDDGGGEGGGVGGTRMATILPILRMTLQATIVVLTVLLALSQLGVNITPLLAGAGVLGLAIGFGAQTLVKDIVSGVFFLLDDAFRKGEYIDVGGTAGTVEKISVRSLQLRGVTGPIHVMPYGSISSLTNHSRDWVIMKLKFTIPFDTDIEKVRKLFKKIGQQMMEDPNLAPKFLEPFKGQGAADVTDVGIVVRGKFSTRPGDQWEIRKQVYNRVQKAFEENGIEFARKEVWVQMADNVEGHGLSPEQRQAIAGAAAQSVEPDDGANKKPEDPRG